MWNHRQLTGRPAITLSDNTDGRDACFNSRSVHHQLTLSFFLNHNIFVMLDLGILNRPKTELYTFFNFQGGLGWGMNNFGGTDVVLSRIYSNVDECLCWEALLFNS